MCWTSVYSRPIQLFAGTMPAPLRHWNKNTHRQPHWCVTRILGQRIWLRGWGEWVNNLLFSFPFYHHLSTATQSQSDHHLVQESPDGHRPHLTRYPEFGKELWLWIFEFRLVLRIRQLRFDFLPVIRRHDPAKAVYMTGPAIHRQKRLLVGPHSRRRISSL